MLKLNDVTKIYQTASKEKVTALSNVSLSIDKSGIVFIVGQSGSGKNNIIEPYWWIGYAGTRRNTC